MKDVQLFGLHCFNLGPIPIFFDLHQSEPKGEQFYRNIRLEFLKMKSMGHLDLSTTLKEEVDHVHRKIASQS